MYKRYKVKVKETHYFYGTVVAQDKADACQEILDGRHYFDSEWKREHVENDDEIILIEEVSDA